MKITVLEFQTQGNTIDIRSMKKLKIAWFKCPGKPFLKAVFGILLLSASSSWGNSNLDRQYQLETLGFIKAWDNVDGVFAEYASNAYKDYFSRQTRFIINDLSKTEIPLNRSKIQYRKLIYDTEVLNQISQATRTENLIRTLITQEGNKYSFKIDWLHAPRMEVLASIEFIADEPTELSSQNKNLNFISEALFKNIKRLIDQIPILANVTGRDHQSITVNLGRENDIKAGDILTIATLEEVKKHPLLKKVVDWRFIPTGRVQIQEVEEGISFGKIIEEEPNQQIAPKQKIIKIIKQVDPSNHPSELSGISNLSKPLADSDNRIGDSPRLGWIGLGISPGSYSRQFSSQSASISNTGSGLSFGGQAQGELWITRNWFAEAKFDYGTWSFSQKNASTGATSAVSQNGGVTGSAFTAKFDVGYSYLVNDDLFGPKSWVKLGYQSRSYSLPASTSESTGPISFRSVFLGVGGDLPFLEKWGAFANLDFKVFSSVSQTWLSADTTGISDIEFLIGGYYKWSPKLVIRGGLDLISNGADFSDGSHIEQKTITIGPSILYYF